MPEAGLTYLQRKLPHWLPPGETVFVTFRLAGTLPSALLEQVQAEWEAADKQRGETDDKYTGQKRYFGRYDVLSDGAIYGPTWLQQPAVAEMVASRTLPYLKGYIAQKANALLHISGKFWHRESYVHIVQDARGMDRIIS